MFLCEYGSGYDSDEELDVEIIEKIEDLLATGRYMEAYDALPPDAQQHSKV